MGPTKMRLIAFFMALLAAPQAFAGVVIDQFNEALAGYRAAIAAGAASPIRFVDPDGEIAETLLNPPFADQLFAESIQEDGTQLTSFRAAMNEFKPIASSYQAAFKGNPRRYENEYLESFDMMFRLLVAGIRPVTEIDFSQVQDEAQRDVLEATRKLAVTTPKLLSSMLRQQIDAGLYSDKLRPEAEKRLAAHQALLAELAVE